MKFSISGKMPWSVRLAVLFGARVVSGAYVTPGSEPLLVITLGVRWRAKGPYIWWHEWRAPHHQSAKFFALGTMDMNLDAAPKKR